MKAVTVLRANASPALTRFISDATSDMVVHRTRAQIATKELQQTVLSPRTYT